MAPTDAANALQGNRPRPSTVRPIVPAIPLPYIQKRKHHAVAPTKTEEVPASVTSADPPITTSPPVADIPPPTTNGNADATEHAEVGAELPPITPVIQAVDDSVDASVDEVQEAAGELALTGE
jgi:hypothetical protein